MSRRAAAGFCLDPHDKKAGGAGGGDRAALAEGERQAPGERSGANVVFKCGEAAF